MKSINLSNNEHWALLKILFSKIDDKNISLILDAGSGKTSLSSILKYFNKAYVDVVIFPGDDRKGNSIRLNIESNRYNLFEKDICKGDITKKYDLVLAHLLFGESLVWGNDFKSLFEKIFKIDSKYFIVMDFLEDIDVDYNYLEKYLENNNFEIIIKKSIDKEKPQQFKKFVGKKYVGYLIKKIY